MQRFCNGYKSSDSSSRSSNNNGRSKKKASLKVGTAAGTNSRPNLEEGGAVSLTQQELRETRPTKPNGRRMPEQQASQHGVSCGSPKELHTPRAVSQMQRSLQRSLQRSSQNSKNSNPEITLRGGRMAVGTSPKRIGTKVGASKLTTGARTATVGSKKRTGTKVAKSGASAATPRGRTAPPPPVLSKFALVVVESTKSHCHVVTSFVVSSPAAAAAVTDHAAVC